MQPLPLSHPGLPGELVLLAAERTVTVTREEHHQDVLAGRAGPTIASCGHARSPRASTRARTGWRSCSTGAGWAS